MKFGETATAAEGSSPRVRGKLTALMFDTIRLRLIPARAGKTSTSPTPSRSRSAHPRACGENHALLVNDPNALGSSPRVRGKPAGLVGHVVQSRLIPARAGKTT